MNILTKVCERAIENGCDEEFTHSFCGRAYSTPIQQTRSFKSEGFKRHIKNPENRNRMISGWKILLNTVIEVAEDEERISEAKEALLELDR